MLYVGCFNEYCSTIGLIYPEQADYYRRTGQPVYATLEEARVGVGLEAARRYGQSHVISHDFVGYGEGFLDAQYQVNERFVRRW